MVLANQNAKLTGPDQGFLVSPLDLKQKPWERGCSMANQIWIFHIHISKMTSKSQYEKDLDAFAPYYYDDENHIDSLTPLI